MKIEIKESVLENNVPQILALAELSAQETNTEPALTSLDLILTMYQNAEANGRLVLLTAHADFLMVGYSVGFLVNNMHYAQELICMNDSLFVHPDYRKGTGAGLALLRATADYARKRGARHLMQGAKKGSRMAQLLPRIGFELEETLYRITL